ncbi:protein kinase domain-containing protein [Streptomyces echinatus]|uniref:protein kinase domain-containing protein n=1 Tax=Streptomyces echinatus TaxID=67293 RepID=UPI003812E272
MHEGQRTRGGADDAEKRRVGPYVLERKLGEGGMGEVYLAQRADSPGGPPVALKTVHGRLAREPDFRARFRREVAAAREIDSRFVVPLVDADTDTADPWLATVFVPGPTLADEIRSSGPLPEGRLRALGLALAGALMDIHAAGLVHRDFKPSNVLLHPDKGAQVIDLGIARAVDGTGLTATGLVVGSAGFMAPEQLTGDGARPPSDVFALGAVLAYAATGRQPFGDGPAHRIGYRTLTEEPDLDGAPAALLPLLASCLAKDPAQRPTPRGIRDALTGSGPETEHALEAAVPPGPGAPPPSGEPHGGRPARLLAVPASTRARLGARGRVALIAGALTVLLLGALTAGLIALRGHDAPSVGGRAGNRATARPSPSVPALAEPVSVLGPAVPRGVWSRSWQDTIILQETNEAEYDRATANGNEYAVEAWLTDRVFARVGRRSVQGLSPDTGRVLWTLKPPAPGMVPCAASRTAPGGVGAVIFGPADEKGQNNGTVDCDRVVAVDLASGTSLWERHRPGDMYATDTIDSDVLGIAGDRVVVMTGDLVTAWRLRDGAPAWSQTGSRDACVINGMAVGQSSVVEALTCPATEESRRNGRPTTVRSVNAADGRVRWTSTVPDDVPVARVETAEPPVISLPGPISDIEGPMMIFSNDGRPGPQLREAQPQGTLGVWTRNRFQLTPAFFGWRDTVVTLTQYNDDRQSGTDGVVALDSRTGKIRWHRPAPSGGEPVIAGVDDRGVLVVHVTEPGTTALVRYALDDGTPTAAGELPRLPDRAEFDGVRLYGGRLALMTGQHNLLTKGVMMFRASGSRP